MATTTTTADAGLLTVESLKAAIEIALSSKTAIDDYEGWQLRTAYSDGVAHVVKAVRAALGSK